VLVSYNGYCLLFDYFPKKIYKTTFYPMAMKTQVRFLDLLLNSMAAQDCLESEDLNKSVQFLRESVRSPLSVTRLYDLAIDVRANRGKNVLDEYAKDILKRLEPYFQQGGSLLTEREFLHLALQSYGQVMRKEVTPSLFI
jgi:hypothetical protein